MTDGLGKKGLTLVSCLTGSVDSSFLLFPAIQSPKHFQTDDLNAQNSKGNISNS